MENFLDAKEFVVSKKILKKKQMTFKKIKKKLQERKYPQRLLQETYHKLVNMDRIILLRKKTKVQEEKINYLLTLTPEVLITIR